MTIPLMNLSEEFLNLFDEPEKAISLQSKAKDNKEDELKKIVDETAKNIETSREQPIMNGSKFPNLPQPSDAPFQEEGSTSNSKPMIHSRGRI